MFQSQHLSRPPSFRGSLKALEADINHANTLADAVHRAYGGSCLQMRLSCSPLAPFFFFLMQWLDCTCCYSLPSYLGLFEVFVYKVYVDGMTTVSTFERRASIREFYAVIYPSLQQLEGNLAEKEQSKGKGRAKEVVGRKRMEDWRKFFDKDIDREDECGICLEVCTKMVLPNCNHAMCIKCYRDWNVKSQSCPFCRGSIKRVRSRDLWVLTNKSDVVDTTTLEMDNVRRFYRYIDSLPLIIPAPLKQMEYKPSADLRSLAKTSTGSRWYRMAAIQEILIVHKILEGLFQSLETIVRRAPAAAVTGENRARARQSRNTRVPGDRSDTDLPDQSPGV